MNATGLYNTKPCGAGGITGFLQILPSQRTPYGTTVSVEERPQTLQLCECYFHYPKLKKNIIQSFSRPSGGVVRSSLLMSALNALQVNLQHSKAVLVAFSDTALAQNIDMALRQEHCGHNTVLNKSAF